MMTTPEDETLIERLARAACEVDARELEDMRVRHEQVYETCLKGSMDYIDGTSAVVDRGKLLDHVATLRAERDELREALEPFAKIEPTIIGDEELPHYWVVNGNPGKSSFTADDLRRARADLSTKPDTQETGEKDG